MKLKTIFLCLLGLTFIFAASQAEKKSTIYIPATQITDDFEYFISAVSGDGAEYQFPATAPAMNQTVVVY